MQSLCSRVLEPAPSSVRTQRDAVLMRQLVREGGAVARCTDERLVRLLGLQHVRRGKGVASPRPTPRRRAAGPGESPLPRRPAEPSGKSLAGGSSVRCRPTSFLTCWSRGAGAVRAPALASRWPYPPQAAVRLDPLQGTPNRIWHRAFRGLHGRQPRHTAGRSRGTLLVPVGRGHYNNEACRTGSSAGGLNPDYIA